MNFGKLALALALWTIALPPAGFAQSASPADMQTAHTFKRRVSETIRLDYLLFLPKGYDRRGSKRWPLILFLHGAGERGADLARVKVHGPPKLVASRPDFPFIVVSPQCPEYEIWDSDALLRLLDEVIDRYKVDTNRVYLTGLSMGGYGTWTLGSIHPERFAAIAPICGGGNTIDVHLGAHERNGALKGLAVWAFHGAKDPVVPLDESERMVDSLKKAGCHEVKLTVYPDAGHDSWTETYANPALYDWFLQHERKPAQAKEAKARRPKRDLRTPTQ
jgi:predicted peptidase